MKKNFVPSFHPPRIARTKAAWYISWYSFNSSTGLYDRYRQTFSLNRIKDLAQREARAQELALKISSWLSSGSPGGAFVENFSVASGEPKATPERPKKFDTLAGEALEFMRKLKTNGSRLASNRTWNSTITLYLDYLNSRNLTSLAIADIPVSVGADYLDFCVTVRSLGARSYNNTLSRMRTLYSDLIKRGYLEVNPFAGFTAKKVGEKGRRAFLLGEARAVALAVATRRRLLFYALVLEYACYLRPAEMRRLRFEDFDLTNYTVHVPASKEKTWRAKTCLIPEHYRYLFDEPFWSAYPLRHFIFGKGFAPHASKQCGERTMNAIHREILKDLHLSGELSDLTGLSWYSWKDTGITDALYEIDPSTVQDQAGHADIAITMIYKAKGRGPKGMAKFKGSLGNEKH